MQSARAITNSTPDSTNEKTLLALAALEVFRQGWLPVNAAPGERGQNQRRGGLVDLLAREVRFFREQFFQIPRQAQQGIGRQNLEDGLLGVLRELRKAEMDPEVRNTVLAPAVEPVVRRQ